MASQVKSSKSSQDNFFLNDVEMLLRVIQDYKVAKDGEKVDGNHARIMTCKILDHI